MSIYSALKRDVFLTGCSLRDMGAANTDTSGILWTPGDQLVSKDGRSVALMPDPESLRQFFAKRAKALTAKTSPRIAGPKNGPAYAYERMLARPGMRTIMQRLQRRGLVPRAPQSYASLKTMANRSAPKPAITASTTIRRSIGFLQARPEMLEAMAGPVRRGLKTLIASQLPVPGFA